MPVGGSQILVLNGYDAGEIFWVAEKANKTEYQGWYSQPLGAPSGHLTMQTLELTLYREFPLTQVPEWWPPFGVQHSFLLDEVAVWLCNKCIIGSQFVLPTDEMAMAAAMLWLKKIAITPEEFSLLLVAHGMPVAFRKEVEVLFSVGTSALHIGSRKLPVKKWRSVGLLQKEFAEAMRLWGRRPPS